MNLIASPVRFALNLYLARCLLPEDFGTMVIPSVIVVLSNILIDSGFKASLIQKSTLKLNHCSTIFFVNLGVSLLLCSLFCLIAYPLELYFKIYNLAIFISIASSSLVIRSVAMVSEARMQIKGKYGQLIFIEMISYIIGYSVSIFLAKKGYGAFSLVALAFISATGYTLGLFYIERFIPKLNLVSKKLFFLHWRMGKNLLGQGIMETLSDKIDEVILGKFIGISKLGLYSKGREYTNTLGIIGSKFFARPWFSIMSKQSTNKLLFTNKFKLAFLILILGGMIMISGNFYFGEFFIRNVLGNQWSGLIKLFQYFIISTSMYYLVTFNKYTFLALGNPEVNLKIEVYYAGIRLIGLSIIFFLFNKSNFIIYLLISLDIVSRIAMLVMQSFSLSKLLNKKIDIFIIFSSIIMIGLGITSIILNKNSNIFIILFFAFTVGLIYKLYNFSKLSSIKKI